MIKKLAVALVHYPVFDRTGKKVATNVTHFDIHDIARVCRVYGIDRYYIVHPSREQLMFVSRVLDHWRVGPGRHFNPMRKTALTMVEPVESLEAARESFNELVRGYGSQLIATSARDIQGEQGLDLRLGFREVRGILEKENVLLVFGTGFGLSPDVFKVCNACLEPIKGFDDEDYRHLSVRSAVSICLDRLRGSW